MLTFIEYITERMADPVELAKRAARRYGDKPYRSGSMKVGKGDYIPFNKVAHPSQIASAVMKYEKHSSVPTERKEFSISDLFATQHHASIGDEVKLKSKIEDTDPEHIHIITHKGKHFVADGHNAIMAARLRGDKTVMANHSDLDKI